MAQMPEMLIMARWNKTAAEEFENQGLASQYHPSIYLLLKRTYMQGYVRRALREWQDDAQVKSFAASLENAVIDPDT